MPDPTRANTSKRITISPEPSEALVSFLTCQCALVFRDQDKNERFEQVIQQALAMDLISQLNTEIIGDLLEVQPISTGDQISRFEFLPGRDPRENLAVKGALNGQSELSKESTSGCRDRLTGVLFGAIERSSPGRFTWRDTTAVLDANIRIVAVEGEGEFYSFQLTDRACALAASYEQQAQQNGNRVLDLLGGNDTPDILKRLYHQHTPGFLARQVRQSDRPVNSPIAPDSRILSEKVVTGISFTEAEDGRVKVSGTIYYPEELDGKVKSCLSHELIEVGIMQRVARLVQGSVVPPSFFAQLLAEENISDLLVWCLQHKLLKDYLEPNEAFSNSDRAVVMLITEQLDAFPAASLLGSAHPFAMELSLYHSAALAVLNNLSQQDVQCILNYNQDRSPSPVNKERYGQVVDNFLKDFFGEISKSAAQFKGIPLLLNDPELLFT